MTLNNAFYHAHGPECEPECALTKIAKGSFTMTKQATPNTTDAELLDVGIEGLIDDALHEAYIKGTVVGADEERERILLAIEDMPYQQIADTIGLRVGRARLLSLFDDAILDAEAERE